MADTAPPSNWRLAAELEDRALLALLIDLVWEHYELTGAKISPEQLRAALQSPGK